MDTLIEAGRQSSGLGRVKISGNYRTKPAISRFPRIICERPLERLFKEYNMTTNLDNLTKQQMLDMIKQLDEEKKQLKAMAKKTLHCKVGAKGGISVYGFGRFPVTLYKEQWSRLIEFVPELQAFIAEHEAELKVKA
jgi:hypothetical protein